VDAAAQVNHRKSVRSLRILSSLAGLGRN